MNAKKEEKEMLRKSFFILFYLLICILTGSECSYGALSFGQAAPVFTLSDITNQSHDLSQLKEKSMIILFFFDVDSNPSKEGMLSLNQLVREYRESDLTIWAMTLSSKEKAANFASVNRIAFPILLDTSGVSKVYQANLILPTAYIIGPGLKILNYIQGGGKTTEIMLVNLAERMLQKKQPKFARTLARTVTAKNPHNTRAKAIEGIAAMREGNIKESEDIYKELATRGDDGEILGKEGLAALYTKGGQFDKAMKIINEVEQKDPERSYIYVVKGDLLYALNKKGEAESAYKIAAEKKHSEPYQDSVRYGRAGRAYAASGQYGKAQQNYDKAIEIDPYDIEDMTNKGVAYEKEGKYDKAVESYRRALTIDKNDTFAAVLVKKAQEMLDVQKDIERKRRMDHLIKDLVERYKSQKASPPKVEDEWTSRPMVMSFVDFQEKGALSERDGLSNVIVSQLTDALNASGRVNVVERTLVERLLEELNLGSSELASPDTALKLGRILAAKLIGTGSLFNTQIGTTLTLRLIDTETSAIPQINTKQLGSQASLNKELLELDREILRTVVSKYPLRGYIVRTSDDAATINLGSKQGVVQGTKFDVLEEQESITYRGRTLLSSPKSVATVEVVRLEPDLCHVKALKKERPLKVDDKVQEKIEEAAPR
jgi:tetratricopeptide (TPR) repeat protein/peroxiredoxin